MIKSLLPKNRILSKLIKDFDLNSKLTPKDCLTVVNKLTNLVDKPSAEIVSLTNLFEEQEIAPKDLVILARILESHSMGKLKVN